MDKEIDGMQLLTTYTKTTAFLVKEEDFHKGYGNLVNEDGEFISKNFFLPKIGQSFDKYYCVSKDDKDKDVNYILSNIKLCQKGEKLLITYSWEGKYKSS